MKLKRTLTYRLILDYLKDTLSDNKRHIVEKELMRDVFDEEAFEGLSSLPADEIEKDIAFLQQKLNERKKNKNRVYLYNIFKVAASIIILIGIVITVRITNKKTELPLHKQIAEKKEYIPEKHDELKEENVTSASEKSYTPAPIADEKDIKTPKVVDENLTEAPTATVKEELQDISVEDEIYANEIQVPTEVEPIELAAGPYKEEKEIIPGTKQARRSLSLEKTKTVSSNAIHGRVTDNNGNPLPGVNIIEKGTSNGAISDINGEFEIELKDTKNPLEFKFLGYITEETTAENIKNNDIKLVEDLVAIDEVVVIGYGTQKKSDITGAVSSIQSQNMEETETIQARPPTGSVLSFKKYIYNKIDYSKFIDLTEKQKIVVEFIIDDKGKPGNYKFKQPADERICNEIKRIIDEAGKWQPSAQNGVAIVSQIRLRLVIDPISRGK